MGDPDSLVIDERQWPLVAVRWPARAASSAELDRLLTSSERWLARREPFAMLTDSRGAAVPNALQRKRISEDAKKNEAALGRYVVASAVVVDNSIMQAVITAVNWLAPPAYPVKVFTDPQAAEAWARAKLAAQSSAAKPTRA